MHELSIAENLVAQVQKHLAGRERFIVRAVGIRIGDLTDVSSEALQFGYQIACQGTALAGSQLQIAAVPVAAHCKICRRQTEIEQYLFLCSHCGSADIEVTSGLELDLAWVDIDDIDSESSRPEPEATSAGEGSP